MGALELAPTDMTLAVAITATLQMRLQIIVKALCNNHDLDVWRRLLSIACASVADLQCGNHDEQGCSELLQCKQRYDLMILASATTSTCSTTTLGSVL